MDGIPIVIAYGRYGRGWARYLVSRVRTASNLRGVVIIDGIESGFYYDSLAALLKGACDFAEDNNVQLLAMTHRYERRLLRNSLLCLQRRRKESFVPEKQSTPPCAAAWTKRAGKYCRSTT
jgi:AAA15 family ATPase/GTPase